MKTHALLITFLAAAASTFGQSAIITKWDFNTGSLAPTIGSGSIATFGGVTSLGCLSAAAKTTNSSDTASTNKSWFTSNYPQRGTRPAYPGTTESYPAGIQANISTAGFKNIVISWDQNQSGRSNSQATLQYTLDSNNWIDANSFYGSWDSIEIQRQTTWFPQSGGIPSMWFNNRTVSLTSIAGLADNPNFGFRIVPKMMYFPGGMDFSASDTSLGRVQYTYSSTGSWGFDMITVTGTPIPEPATYAIILGGLALSFVTIRRKKLAQ